VLPYLEMTQSGVFNWCAVYECPVAASDHRYFERLRTEWGCVATFDVEDRAETVDRIRSLLASDDERRRLSDAIATYRDAHSFEAVARSHADLYRRIDGAEP
jgi:glycosyltransferase involved in cell wall biosynthesis